MKTIKLPTKTVADNAISVVTPKYLLHEGKEFALLGGGNPSIVYAEISWPESVKRKMVEFNKKRGK